MLKNRLNQLGFTLVEIMVAVVINLILFAGLLTFFVNNLEHYRKEMNINRLYDQLHLAMQLMANDIRRAGYWANVSNDIGTNQNNNPFMVTGTSDVIVNNTNNCILFSYDHDNNGSLASVSSASDDERYGYRLNNGVLQARPPGAAYSCTASSTNWENMTDPNVITITNLTFTLNSTTITTGPGSQGIIIRSVDITLTGRLTRDNSVTKTVSQHVRIRNDKFIP